MNALLPPVFISSIWCERGTETADLGFQQFSEMMLVLMIVDVTGFLVTQLVSRGGRNNHTFGVRLLYISSTEGRVCGHKYHFVYMIETSGLYFSYYQ